MLLFKIDTITLSIPPVADPLPWTLALSQQAFSLSASSFTSLTDI